MEKQSQPPNLGITVESTREQVMQWLQSFDQGGNNFSPLYICTGVMLLGLSENQLVELCNSKALAIALYNTLHPRQPEVKQGLLEEENSRLAQLRKYLAIEHITIDEKVIDTLKRYYSSRVLLIGNSRDARELYNEAKRMPQSSTRACFLKEYDLAVDGPFPVGDVSKATLLYAFETCGVPRVIKIIENEKDLRQEFSIWEIISKGAEMDNINLVPILKCVAIPREKGKGSVGGLLMPVYICSLATVPIPSSPQHLLHCTKQVKLALDQMHGSGIGHCDVKPQNIFLDSSGNHFLGDYGAAQRIGDEVVEVSWNYFPDVDWKASKKLDYALLVVSILSQSNVRSIAGPDPSKRTIPILRKEVVETFQMRDLELMNLLLSLLDIK